MPQKETIDYRKATGRTIPDGFSAEGHPFPGSTPAAALSDPPGLPLRIGIPVLPDARLTVDSFPAIIGKDAKIKSLFRQSRDNVGGERTAAVDVRVISASNRSLKKELHGGRFRQDLYYSPFIREHRIPLEPLHGVSPNYLPAGP